MKSNSDANAPFPAPTPPLLPAAVPADLTAALEDLFVRGTPPNTLRAYARDLAYISAWKQAAFAAPLAWPEPENIALRFVLDHARDLTTVPTDDPARKVAETLNAAGLRRGLKAPAPATLDRRIASWRAFHRMRNLANPFEAPLVRAARQKARRAVRHRPAKKSENPVTRVVLEDLLATCEQSFRGVRDRALLTLAWASGGRRRSELSELMREDIDLSEMNDRGLIWLRLVETKTTAVAETPKLVLKGRAAKALAIWVREAGIDDGPLFRAISKSDRVLPRRLSPDGVRHVVKSRLIAAGYPPEFASPHGLRAGFLTQAALDGAPIQAAMRLSLHRSVKQAMAYYDDVDIAENPATDLLG
ncbi:MAG: tyrosine-type recombinase/integrase [Pseudomonadota bacterium]